MINKKAFSLSFRGLLYVEFNTLTHRPPSNINYVFNLSDSIDLLR